jgi:chromosome segregation protein
MYIAQLLLKGFKSFGGDHDLSLSPGLTCIVGPNGSGKSNLLDAMRWVLGEGAPSDLRISRQTDLLFQGSASLPPCKETEVAVRLLAGKEACQIRRKVDKEGTGLLTVDGNRIRLQDLDQIKRTWGLEGIRFAFMGQGEIAEIIQQKPLQRRMLLEGLFGIDLYRRKREEAVDRLKRAEEELLRLATLLSELSARREEIAPMVEKARRAREILDALEDQRRHSYWLRRERSEGAVQSLRNRHDILEREQAVHSFWSAGWSRRRDLLERSLSILRTEMETCRQDQAAGLHLLQETLRQAASLASALRRDKDQIQGAKSECSKKREALLVLEQEEKVQRELAASIESELSRKRAAALEAREERLRKRQEAEKRAKEFKILSRRKAELGAEAETLKARLAALGRQCGSLGKEWSEIFSESSRLVKALEEAKTCDDAIGRNCEAAVESHSAAFAASQKAAVENTRLRKQVLQVSSELENLNQKMDGQVFPRPVQFLVAAAKLGRLPVSPVPVIEAFECPNRYVKAIESYLGARQFWLIVKDMEEARLCIDKLRQAQAGRATFLPLERCRSLRFSRDTGLEKEPGVLGWALDLLDINGEWKGAVEHLLGDLLLLEDYGSASNLVRLRPRLAVATLDGEVFMPGGSISGGTQRSGAGGIEIRRRRKELEALLESLHQEEERVQATLSGAEATEIQTAAEKESAFAQKRESQETLRLLKGQKERADRETQQLLEARKKVLENLSATGEKYQAVSSEQKKISALLDSMGEAIEDHSWEEEPTTPETEVLLAEEKQRGARELLGRVEREIRGVRESLKVTEAEIASRGSILAKLLENLSGLGRQYLVSWRQKKELEDRGNGLSSRSERDRKDLVRVVAREGRAQEADRRCRTRLEELGRETLEAENSLAELVAEWEEKHPYPGAGLCEATDLEEVKRKIRNAERILRSMGEVEMGALSEEESLRERTAFLSEQCSDVSEGIRTLQGFIADTDREASRVFGLAMDGIDRRFDTLFQRLFGGGEAHLEIEGAGEGWEAGVDVTARPPGKRPQGLAQLSGGEQSLTAIALLFAAMEEARVPIAILDEADAALDEVNLRRYVELAAEYAGNLQILAMTHRRTTMEKADVLYGVTLSEPGLSQLVGVRMEDWT